MRFAYADPPYPGQAKHWYGDHPDYAGEVDHGELIARLVAEYPDGWALSTSMVALRDVLPLCPPESKVAVWNVSNAQSPGGASWQWHYCWEPVIVCGGRPAPYVRNVLTAANLSGYGGRGENFPGAKPPAFVRWMIALLGATPDDTLDDLFPGSGAIARGWEAYRQAPHLPALTTMNGSWGAVPRAQRRMERKGLLNPMFPREK